MGAAKIISTAMKFHYLTNLNVYIFKKSEGIVYRYEIVSVPDSCQERAMISSLS